MAQNTAAKSNKHTPQNILNWSFDEDFKLLAVMLIGFNGTNASRIKTDINGKLEIIAEGNVASGATDSGNPVKVGGKVNYSPTSFSNGQRADLQLDEFGLLRVHSYNDSAVLDAFNRLRVSSPITLFDVQNEYDTSPLYFEYSTTGGGGVTHLPNESSVSLNVGTASGDKVIKQSREYFRYQPGKSQLVLMTGIFGATKSNVRKRMGYFDANNGIFFEDDGTGFFVVRRTNASGTPTDNRVAQANFNNDKLDGTGPS